VTCRVVTALLVLASWATASAAVSPAGDEDPATAWARYLRSATTLEPGYTFPHADCFRRAALAYGLPLTLLLAVARGESDFDPDAKSRANAHGVMQIQWPETARHLGIERLSRLYEPCVNIDAGARYLDELLARYDGNLHLALAAYNYGPGRIPPGATRIPSGAEWYSGYIYRHLTFVLGDGGAVAVAATLYSEFGRSVLVSFGEPYRAEAFVAHVERSLPDGSETLQIDWFRAGTGQFDVVFTYPDRDAFDRGARRLRQAGFAVE
jgi:hypothetical protein